MNRAAPRVIGMSLSELVPVSEHCGLSPHEWLDIIACSSASAQANWADVEDGWPAEWCEAMLSSVKGLVR
jgi:hypothetical protein